MSMRVNAMFDDTLTHAIIQHNTDALSSADAPTHTTPVLCLAGLLLSFHSSAHNSRASLRLYSRCALVLL